VHQHLVPEIALLRLYNKIFVQGFFGTLAEGLTT